MASHRWLLRFDAVSFELIDGSHSSDAVDRIVSHVSRFRTRDNRLRHLDICKLDECGRCKCSENGMLVVANGDHRLCETVFVSTRSCHRVTASFCILSYESPQLDDHSNDALLSLMFFVNRKFRLIFDGEHGQIDGSISLFWLCCDLCVKKENRKNYSVNGLVGGATKKSLLPQVILFNIVCIGLVLGLT